MSGGQFLRIDLSIRIILLGSLALACSALADQASAQSTIKANTDIPGWQRGVSTWDGASYSSAVAPPQTGSSVNSIKLPDDLVGSVDAVVTADNKTSTSYTVPVDPTSNSLPTNVVQAATPTEIVDAALASIPSYELDPSDSSITLTAHTTPSLPLPPPSGSQTIGEQLQSGTAIHPPLHEETLTWYQYPWRWMTTGWTNHIELGLDGSQGNSETLAIQTGVELKRKTDDYTLGLDFDYRLANSRNVVTEDNGRFNADYDRILNDSPWSLFTKFGMEWDEFKAFDLRLNLNGGVGYHWLRNDRTTLVTRFGAGASKEIGAPDDDWTPEAVFGLEAEHQLNKYNKLRAKVDYFPNWTDFADFRLVTDVAWEILLNDADSLSLKVAATDRYDSTPQGGAKENDLYYSLLLLVKF
ncbi:MAG: DUF481 domain-containing protein [Pirellulaceae bacterium]|nr:DUF481 domain-containing protein [Pirellulaceae bacterium]